MQNQFVLRDIASALRYGGTMTVEDVLAVFAGCLAAVATVVEPDR